MGIISKENRKSLAKFIDEIAKFKNAFMETFDGMAFDVAINTLDDMLLVKLDPKYHPLIDRLAGELGAKDYAAAATTLAEISALAIPTPFVDGTDSEQKLYVGIFSQLENFVSQKLSEHVAGADDTTVTV